MSLSQWSLRGCGHAASISTWSCSSETLQGDRHNIGEACTCNSVINPIVRPWHLPVNDLTLPLCVAKKPRFSTEVIASYGSSWVVILSSWWQGPAVKIKQYGVCFSQCHIEMMIRIYLCYTIVGATVCSNISTRRLENGLL